MRTGAADADGCGQVRTGAGRCGRVRPRWIQTNVEAMAEPLSGQVTAFFLFDVAEGVDLAAVRGLLGASTESPRLAVKPAVPAYVQYQDLSLIHI